MQRIDSRHQPKLLILYASYGEGHIQVARAIRDTLEAYGNNRTVLVDLMAESHPWLNAMTRSFYLKSYTYMPSLYGWVYNLTKPMKHNSMLGGLLHSFGRDKIKRILAEEQPDAVIHTFPFFALPELKKRTSLHPPSYVVITDFDLHGRWVHPSIERYYVATHDLKQELSMLDIPASSVLVSGIPLKRGFRAAAASSELFARYQLQPDKPVVLMMAGAQGVMPDVAEICERLLQDSAVQIALVCGHNHQLKDKMSRLFQKHEHAGDLHVFGFIDQIHELMAISQCLITKPGGVTLSEAIAAGLPIFIYRPVPGQEKQNALYLEAKGAAAVAYSPERLSDEILKLMHDPMRLIGRKQSIRSLQPSHTAADAIVLDILSNIRIMEKASTL
ncbi:Processive diacylglycerol beta-glucosyltransferase [compost metagenome]